MAKQTQTIFLEEWLKSNSSSGSSRPSPPSSARAIIQAWAELRDALQHQTFQSNHILSLQTLLNSQTSLHVADPQAKLLLSILSSPHISLPQESHPLFLRLLYIWARKSSKPSPSLVESTVSFLSRFLSAQFDSEKSYSVVCEAILLLGALSLVPVLSRSSKGVCLELLCKLLEDEYRVIRSREELVPEVLAGIGYTLSSTDSAHFGKILDSLFGIWNKNGGPCSHLSHGLIILHLMEWVVSGSISSRNWRKIEFLCREIFGISHPNYAPFAVVMAAAGVLRAFNRAVSSGNRLEISAQHRVSAEECIEVLARNLVSKTGDLLDTTVDPNNRLLIQCISLGLSRSGSVSFRAPLLLCLASALLIEMKRPRGLWRILYGATAMICTQGTDRLSWCFEVKERS
uniref:Uncharacterized protein n=1 Tax=Nelumbo nucifera TaxID=4432 RepID=A0A822YWG0_NELNU|nr:TPA_asm: hypothetical protein HUJ06_007673 [Nelumbo nucifera]